MNNLEFAINMEEEGEAYYKKQAVANGNNSISKVFTLMAEDEAKHANVLREKFKEESFKLIDNGTLDKSFDIFKDDSENLEYLKDQLDVYRKASQNEQKSIDLYKEIFNEAKDDKTKELFEFLIKEEMDHLNILEEMILMINRSEEWVESAEFGVRQDY